MCSPELLKFPTANDFRAGHAPLSPEQHPLATGTDVRQSAQSHRRDRSLQLVRKECGIDRPEVAGKRSLRHAPVVEDLGHSLSASGPFVRTCRRAGRLPESAGRTRPARCLQARIRGFSGRGASRRGAARSITLARLDERRSAETDIAEVLAAHAGVCADVGRDLRSVKIEQRRESGAGASRTTEHRDRPS